MSNIRIFFLTLILGDKNIWAVSNKDKVMLFKKKKKKNLIDLTAGKKLASYLLNPPFLRV